MEMKVKSYDLKIEMKVRKMKVNYTEKERIMTHT